MEAFDLDKHVASQHEEGYREQLAAKILVAVVDLPQYKYLTNKKMAEAVVTLADSLIDELKKKKGN